jgi:hypothetical protein
MTDDDSLKNLRHPKMAFCCVGCLSERDLLAQRRDYLVVPRRIRGFTFRCESA